MDTARASGRTEQGPRNDGKKSVVGQVMSAGCWAERRDRVFCCLGRRPDYPQPLLAEAGGLSPPRFFSLSFICLPGCLGLGSILPLGSWILFR